MFLIFGKLFLESALGTNNNGVNLFFKCHCAASFIIENENAESSVSVSVVMISDFSSIGMHVGIKTIGFIDIFLFSSWHNDIRIPEFSECERDDTIIITLTYLSNV